MAYTGSAILFDKDKRTISEHISNIFKEGELIREVVIRKFRTTTPHGAIPGKKQSRDVIFYNLDVIISVAIALNPNAAHNFAFGQIPSSKTTSLKDTPSKTTWSSRNTMTSKPLSM